MGQLAQPAAEGADALAFRRLPHRRYGKPFKPLMWSGVGGSTINWAAHFPRLHPSDFRTQTLDESATTGRSAMPISSPTTT